jgi:hypothetical protein
MTLSTNSTKKECDAFSFAFRLLSLSNEIRQGTLPTLSIDSQTNKIVYLPKVMATNLLDLKVSISFHYLSHGYTSSKTGSSPGFLNYRNPIKPQKWHSDVLHTFPEETQYNNKIATLFVCKTMCVDNRTTQRHIRVSDVQILYRS